MKFIDYLVEDLILDTSKIKIVFVLESPYLEEVIHKHPIAGSSGLSMSTTLGECCDVIDSSIPLGCQIKQNNIVEIGVINCSQYPLDKKVYSCNMETDKSPFREYEIIRKSPSVKNSKNLKANEKNKELLANFKARVARLVFLNKRILFIPCGAMARNYIEECSLKHDNIFQYKTPHPSRNQWKNHDNFQNYQKFINKISSIFI